MIADLVLSGGGANGAYQAGVIHYLNKRGVTYSSIYGVSAGALNACAVAQGDVSTIIDLWRSIRRKDIYRGGLNFFTIAKKLIGGSRSLYDSAPLAKTVRRHVDYDRLLGTDRPRLRIGAVDYRTGKYFSRGPESFTEEDFYKILTVPKNALIKQYRSLLESEGVDVEFTDGAIRDVARIAAEVNSDVENIGARRLHTILTTLLEEILFDVPDANRESKIVVDSALVDERLSDIVRNRDLSQYIL